MKSHKTVFIFKDHSKSVFYIGFTLVAGLLLLLFPQMTTSVVFWGMAAALMIAGAVQMIGNSHQAGVQEAHQPGNGLHVGQACPHMRPATG